MASAYSTPKQFDNYVQPVNLELVNFVLGSKEQKFNYNIAKVEQTLADFGNLGLVRDQDKEYLADRINTMVSSMGDLENADWSDSNVERQITSGIKGAIDDKVMKDVQLSRNYNSYLQQVRAIKEKDPEKYSDINFAMGLKNAGADKWIQGEADEFGSLNYMPKVDYMGQMNEVISGYIKTHGTKKVERIPRGDGTYTTVTSETLTPETIRNLWQANMTPEMQKQMQMEAQYMYGELPESQQGQLIEAYESNVNIEKNNLTRVLDIKKAAFNKATGEQKALLGQEIDMLQARGTDIEKQLAKGVSFEEAYLNYHFKGTREKLVEANAFDRQTDVKLDYDELKVLKLRKDILAADNKNKTAAEEAAGTYSQVSDPFIAQDKKVTTFFDRTQEGIVSSVDGYVDAMMSNPKFEEIYGISLADFNKKSEEEKTEFASEMMQNLLDNGVDMASTSAYSGEEIRLVNKYKANKAAFEEVNQGVQASTEEIARNSFKAIQDGYRSGTINAENFNSPIMRKLVTGNKKFDELKPDEQNAFRVEMLDEAIRSGSAGEDIRPFLLKQRKTLIDGIKNEALKQSLPQEEMLTNTRGRIGAYTRASGNLVEGTLDTVAETLGGLLNLDKIFGSQEGRASGNFAEAREFRKEAGRRGDIASLFKNDEGIRELQADEFIVNGEGVNAGDYIKNQYRAMSMNAELKAAELAPKLTSTSALIINPNIKEQQAMFNRASNYLSAHNGASVADFKSSEMYMRVNPENNTVVFSAKLSRAAAKDYSGGDLPENRMISSDPIPMSEIGDMDAIMGRIKTQEDEWALNSSNKYAQNLKFTTSGFASTEQRLGAVEAMMDKLPPEMALQLSQSPESLGLTHGEMETYMEAATREKAGQQVALQQEFPNAYNTLVSGKGKFEIEYKSKHNQGYFMDIMYVLGNNRIPIQTSIPTGSTVLDPDEKYLEAYQAQTEIFLNMIQGYTRGNTDVINKLKEINKING